MVINSSKEKGFPNCKNAKLNVYSGLKPMDLLEENIQKD